MQWFLTNWFWILIGIGFSQCSCSAVGVTVAARGTRSAEATSYVPTWTWSRPKTLKAIRAALTTATNTRVGALQF